MEYADNARKARECDIEIGDKVLIKNFAQGKLQPKYLAEPFTVKEKCDSGIEVRVENDSGHSYRRHVDAVKKWNFQLNSDQSASSSEAALPATSTNIDASTATTNAENDNSISSPPITRRYPQRVRKPVIRAIEDVNEVQQSMSEEED